MREPDEEEAELVHFLVGLPVWGMQKPKKMFGPSQSCCGGKGTG